MKEDTTGIKIDGMSYQDVSFNLYAFRKDLVFAERKRSAARSDKMKLHWDKKAKEAIQSLNNNTARMATFHIAAGDCCTTQLRYLWCR